MKPINLKETPKKIPDLGVPVLCWNEENETPFVGYLVKKEETLQGVNCTFKESSTTETYEDVSHWCKLPVITK